MDKLAELKKMEAEMEADATLPLRGEANLVFGEGSVDCKVMLIGEAPGANEDRLRRPFVGRGGAVVDDMIRDLGWKREDVYITNIVKRRPPENRDPSPAEIEAYKPYLTRQIEIIAPKVIVTLGRFSMNYFLPEAKITRDHGRPLRIDGRIIFPVYHPAAGLRSTEMMAVLRADFKKIPGVLAGDFDITLPLAFGPGPANGKKSGMQKRDEKPRQAGLF